MRRRAQSAHASIQTLLGIGLSSRDGGSTADLSARSAAVTGSRSACTPFFLLARRWIEYRRVFLQRENPRNGVIEAFVYFCSTKILSRQNSPRAMVPRGTHPSRAPVLHRGGHPHSGCEIPLWSLAQHAPAHRDPLSQTVRRPPHLSELESDGRPQSIVGRQTTWSPNRHHAVRIRRLDRRRSGRRHCGHQGRDERRRSESVLGSTDPPTSPSKAVPGVTRDTPEQRPNPVPLT